MRTFINGIRKKLTGSQERKPDVSSALEDMDDTGPQPILSVRNLCVSAPGDIGSKEILSQVSFSLEKGECLAIVGQSGSGKTMVCRAMLGTEPEQVEASGVMNIGQSEIQLSCRRAKAALRGRSLAMVHQDPTSILDPLRSIGFLVREVLNANAKAPVADVDARVHSLLRAVDLDPEKVVNAYAHELSGGMCQRVVIALCLAANSKVILADEPTTALDPVTAQKTLELLCEIKESTGNSVLLISHDLGAVETVADRIGVLYAGRLIEIGPAKEILNKPAHPYTKSLVEMAQLTREVSGRYRVDPLVTAKPTHLKGCVFQENCSRSIPDCSVQEPTLTNTGISHQVACFDGFGGDRGK